MLANVAAWGQMVIPRALRARLGIRPGLVMVQRMRQVTYAGRDQ
jgi:bifunctional DNA-binding transcriptional regulator/antitoxin component of YhaV-PrlF toxin-antitoxin module